MTHWRVTVWIEPVTDGWDDAGHKRLIMTHGIECATYPEAVAQARSVLTDAPEALPEDMSK